MIEQALIIAAGNGTRLLPHVSVAHKALVPIHGEPLLLRTCRMLDDLGIREIIVVTGYMGAALRNTLTQSNGLNCKLTFLENGLWSKSNGISVLRATGHLESHYLLLMADHLFDPHLLKMMAYAKPNDGEVVLAVDKKLDSIFDMDDATKVRVEGDHIIEIGKELADFNAVDTGLFSCSTALIHHLKSVEKSQGDCSLSDGVRALTSERRFLARDIGGCWWQDVDTPGAHEHGEELMRLHLLDQSTTYSSGKNQ